MKNTAVWVQKKKMTDKFTNVGSIKEVIFVYAWLLLSW
jgi:hypothetical protein